MKNIELAERLSHSEKVVMREIYKLMNINRAPHVQARDLNRRLMKEFGWARNANYVYIKRLQDKGYIIREEGRGYWLRPSMTMEEMMSQCFEYWLTDFDVITVTKMVKVVFDLMGATSNDIAEVRELLRNYTPKA